MKDDSPISSGWQGNINGHIKGTKSYIAVSEITIKLDYDTAWALCNLLHDESVERSLALEKSQRERISNLGAALGEIIDNGSANNGGRNRHNRRQGIDNKDE